MNPSMLTVLAEPKRLDIVDLLYKSPRSVNEIVFALKLNQPQVSKHLRVLADAGIVDVTPVKNQRIYELKPIRFKELHTWLEKYRAFWEERFDRLDKLLRVEKIKLKKYGKKGGVV